MSFRADGAADADGREFWFIPGRFGFCLACGDQPVAQARERNKLAGLTAEGRSSATTTLVSGMLEALNAPESEVPEAKRKTLGFTDNRQDAALQAGHFNDTVFVSLLRGAILRAVIDAGEDGLEDEAFGRAVQKALGFLPERASLLDVDPGGEGQRTRSGRAIAGQGSGASCLGRSAPGLAVHLSQSHRSRSGSAGVRRAVGVAGRTARSGRGAGRVARARPGPAGKVSPQDPRDLLEGLAVDAEALDADTIEPVAQRSRSLLTPPWALDASEELRKRTALVLEAPPRRQTSKRDAMTLLRGGFRSGLGRDLNRPSVLGRRLKGEEFDALVAFLLGLLEEFGIVGSVTTSLDVTGWQLSAASVRLCPGPAVANPDLAPNRFFHDLYAQIARDLDVGTPPHRRVRGARTYRPGEPAAPRMAGMALPRDPGGRATDVRGEDRYPGGRRKDDVPADALLLADDGARRRYLGAERGLFAQRPADAGELRAAGRARRTVGAGRGHHHLLRGAKPA
jgi:hypothetical protein